MLVCDLFVVLVGEVDFGDWVKVIGVSKILGFWGSNRDNLEVWNSVINFEFLIKNFFNNNYFREMFFGTEWNF